jgi:toxin ParE1/3/4
VAYSVSWTSPAWRDLEEIAQYLAQDSPTYAAGLVRRVRDLARSLADFPLRGRSVPELASPDVREVFISSYRLVYEVRGQRVFVLGLIHGMRDLSALWDREGR